MAVNYKKLWKKVYRNTEYKLLYLMVAEDKVPYNSKDDDGEVAT